MKPKGWGNVQKEFVQETNDGNSAVLRAGKTADHPAEQITPQTDIVRRISTGSPRVLLSGTCAYPWGE